ncbi:MAG: hypothetical protein R2715_00725 [Ilumatobacteraceae bacterium]
MSPTGVITEIIDPIGDGAGNTLGAPYALSIDGANNVYVAGSTSRNVFRIDPAEAASPDSSVSLSGDGLATPRQTKVANDGSFSFDGLEPGAYVVTVTAAGGFVAPSPSGKISVAPGEQVVAVSGQVPIEAGEFGPSTWTYCSACSRCDLAGVVRIGRRRRRHTSVSLAFRTGSCGKAMLIPASPAASWIATAMALRIRTSVATSGACHTRHCKVDRRVSKSFTTTCGSGFSATPSLDRERRG